MEYLKNKIDKFLNCNKKFVEPSMSKFLSKKESNNLKSKFNSFIFAAKILSVCIFMISSYYFIDFIISASGIFKWLGYLVIYLLVILVTHIIAKLSGKYEVWFIALLIFPYLLALTTFHMLLNISKKIIIIEKEVEEGHITKISLNLQELKYKDGLLSSNKCFFSVVNTYKNDSYEGDYYYKGVKYVGERYIGGKILTIKQYETFKQKVEENFFKKKINQF